MRRREFLRVAGSGAVAGLAGCTDALETRSALAPPLVEDRPAAAYIPTHYEGMEMVGTQTRDGYACALTYTYPHRFWLPKPQGMTKVKIEPDDSVHLMPIVWETNAGLVPPDVNPQATITRDGESVTQFAPWPMLSQPMGFHFGDNVELDGDGTYTVQIDVGGPSVRRTGSLSEREGNVSFRFDFEFDRSTLEDVAYTDVPADEEGTKGAVDPTSMATLPSSQVPTPESLPGDVRGSGTSGDARFVVTVLEDATRFGGEGPYLAVSPRTPYNRYVLPMMSLSGTLARGEETAFDGVLRPTIDPDLSYHYGATVSDVESGDVLTVTVDSPPQTARHEGYETAFVTMPPFDVTL